MDHADRELLAHRISSGLLRCHLDGVFFVLHPPTPEDRYYAQCEYVEAYGVAHEAGLYTPAELRYFLEANGLWNAEQDALVADLEGDVEKLKVKLYEACYREADQAAIRKMLAAARDRIQSLRLLKHSYDSVGAEAHARSVRSRTLIARCLRRIDNTTFWATPESYALSNLPLLDDIACFAAASACDESTYREVAREEPWRSLWATRKSEACVFGVPAVCLTDEQRALVAWSSTYEAIREHPECPPDEVISDDDMLDGWMIVQRRVRDTDTNKRRAEALVKGPAAGCQEVFIVAGSAKEAALIESLNDPMAAAAKQSKLAAIKKHGLVAECDLPDVQSQLRMEAVRLGKVQK